VSPHMAANASSFHPGVNTSTSQTLPGVQPQQGQKPQSMPTIAPEHHQKVIQTGINAASESAFQQLLPTYIKNAGIVIDEQLLTIDGRRIDLHRLHAVVFGLGGYSYVRFLHKLFPLYWLTLAFNR
jgi:hypothetical protein